MLLQFFLFRLYYIEENWSCSSSCYKKNRELPLNETFPMWGNYRMIHNKWRLISSKSKYFQKLAHCYLLIYWYIAIFFRRGNFDLNKNSKHPWWWTLTMQSKSMKVYKTFFPFPISKGVVYSWIILVIFIVFAKHQASKARKKYEIISWKIENRAPVF